MSKKAVKGIVTGGILGATIVTYILGRKFQKRKAMKNKRKVLNRIVAVMKGFNIF
ncbi:MAG: hypothetical protein ACOCG5_08345 [Candidatus Alkaliphilus sp. MAG34]|nr:hypothetical protein [Clostridiales bacterium]